MAAAGCAGPDRLADRGVPDPRRVRAGPESRRGRGGDMDAACRGPRTGHAAPGAGAAARAGPVGREPRPPPPRRRRPTRRRGGLDRARDRGRRGHRRRRPLRRSPSSLRHAGLPGARRRRTGVPHRPPRPRPLRPLRHPRLRPHRRHRPLRRPQRPAPRLRPHRHPRHSTPDGAGFHTLYGHLDRATLGHLSPGDRVAPGDVIGWLGDASVNGGWPPHLHLQVIALDPLFDEGTPPEDRGNYTGVVLHRLRAVWESILPDPAPLAGLPSGRAPRSRPKRSPSCGNVF